MSTDSIGQMPESDCEKVRSVPSQDRSVVLINEECGIVGLIRQDDCSSQVDGGQCGTVDARHAEVAPFREGFLRVEPGYACVEIAWQRN